MSVPTSAACVGPGVSGSCRWMTSGAKPRSASRVRAAAMWFDVIGAIDPLLGNRRVGPMVVTPVSGGGPSHGAMTRVSQPTRPSARASPRTWPCTPPKIDNEYGHTSATRNGSITPALRLSFGRSLRLVPRRPPSLRLSLVARYGSSLAAHARSVSHWSLATARPSPPTLAPSLIGRSLRLVPRRPRSLRLSLGARYGSSRAAHARSVSHWSIAGPVRLHQQPLVGRGADEGLHRTDHRLGDALDVGAEATLALGGDRRGDAPHVEAVGREEGRTRQQLRAGAERERGRSARHGGGLAEEVDGDTVAHEVTIAQEAHDAVGSQGPRHVGSGVRAERDDLEPDALT